MPRADWGLAVALSAATLATRWPYRVRLLPTWDAVQFALALDRFDIVRHQPHPPGYLLYVALGRILAPLAGDPAGALTALATAASAVAVLLLYRLGWSLHGRGAATLAASGLAASPLFWSQGLVPLPYAVEAALATAVALAAWQMQGGRPGALAGAAVLLGLAGGVRQSSLLVLGPLWLGMAWLGYRRLRPVAGGLALVALTAATWVAPMLWLTGVDRYRAAAVDLYRSTVHATTLLGGGVAANLFGLGEALGIGLGAFLPVLLWGLLQRAGRRTRLGGPRAIFFGVWTVPALVLYAGVHLGQHGYLLALLPAGYLLVGQTLADLLARVRAALPRPWAGGVLAGLAVAGLLGANAALFLAAPAVDVPFPGAGAPWRVRADAGLRAVYRFRLWPHTAPGLRESQAVIRTYVEAVRARFDPSETVLVTELGNPRSYPWFRHATYYLPEFPAYHLRLGAFSPGYLRSWRLDSMAAIEARDVPLPAGTRRIVWVVDHWHPDVPKPAGLEAQALPHGRWLYVLQVGPRALHHAGYRLARVTALAGVPVGP
jgi:hypothetical protein